MKGKCKYRGFSLTEVLMSVGILAVGMIFIAGMFPVAIYFTTVAAERTTAAIVADEAFAKIRLYGVNFDPHFWPGDPGLSMDINRTLACVDFNDVSSVTLYAGEFEYPSSDEMTTRRQYCWSALCRRVDLSLTNRNVQVTVFVCRRIGAGGNYWDRDLAGTLMTVLNPVPVWVNVGFSASGRADELSITDDFNDGISEETFINGGYAIVDNRTGQIYRVLERYADTPDTILLDRDWDPASPLPGVVWVVPAPYGGGKYPCVAVYQKVIQF